MTGDRRTVEFESQVGSNLAPKVGQEVTVLYDPLGPNEARIRSFMMLWALPSIFTVLGGLARSRRAASAGSPPALRDVRRSILLLALCAALLFGCEGGTLSNYSQSCTSTGGLLAGRTVTCSGEAESLSGSVGIELDDQDDEEVLSGT